LVNERICNLRPVPEVRDDIEMAELKKKLQSLFITDFRGYNAVRKT